MIYSSVHNKEGSHYGSILDLMNERLETQARQDDRLIEKLSGVFRLQKMHWYRQMIVQN